MNKTEIIENMKSGEKITLKDNLKKLRDQLDDYYSKHRVVDNVSIKKIPEDDWKSITPDVVKTELNGCDVFKVDDFKVINSEDGIMFTTMDDSTESCVNEINKISAGIVKRSVSRPLDSEDFYTFKKDARDGKFPEFDENECLYVEEYDKRDDHIEGGEFGEK